ncbi:hypothetical protein PEBR_28395 [Penicillium brasilianum]|uniref:Myb-like DNA-binding domain-containing protein n=1 Tax=Penicillium brasilianum TaxID=104259 RepID=A0A1S9RHX5_PENBI|nr:hypothetical protein PEBR_28395 [Penicillium brasilianum]
MPNRVTKEKAKPRKAPESRFNSKNTTDNSLVLLWLCVNNISGDQINFDAVAAALNITTIAAKFRFRRLKDKMDAKMKAFEESKEAKPESATKPAQPAMEPADI